MCVTLLIPLLDDLPAAVQDDAILATIVILRMSEQHDEYDADRQFHLVPGAFSHYGPIRRSSTMQGGLQEATFYSYVKSDIRVAILGRRGTKLAVDSWPLDNAEPQNDADWANRVTWLLVQAINLCYGGQDIPGLLPRYLLERYVDEWKQDLPDTFDPYYFHEQDTEPFPVIRLLAPWHSAISPVLGIDHASLYWFPTDRQQLSACSSITRAKSFLRHTRLPMRRSRTHGTSTANFRYETGTVHR